MRLLAAFLPIAAIGPDAKYNGQGSPGIDRRYLDVCGPDGDGRHFHHIAWTVPLPLSAGSASRGGSDGDRHHARARRQGGCALPGVTLAHVGHSRGDARRGCRDDRNISRPTGCGLDRQGAGDRRCHQAEALRSGSAARRHARTARGPAAAERERHRGRTAAMELGHADTRRHHAGSARVGAVFRDVDLFPRGANRFPPIHGLILHQQGCKAALHSYHKRHRANLASYLVTVTAINFCLGVAVAIGAWLFGFPAPS